MNYEKARRTNEQSLGEENRTVSLSDLSESLLPGERIEEITFKISGEKLSNSLVYFLVNREKYASVLKDIPHRDLLDLSLVYKVVIDLEDCRMDGPVFTNEMAEEMNLTEEDLFRFASRNTPLKLPPVLTEVDDDLFYIISNINSVAGAAAMLYDGVLDMLAARLDADFYVLPSSIHEVLAVPAGNHDAKELLDMVTGINEVLVEEKDWLSDHIYYYNRKLCSLYVAA